MLKQIVFFIAFAHVVLGASLNDFFIAERSVKDEGDSILICKHEPIDLGIVLDSSSSIAHNDFRLGLEFLKDFLDQFEIGPGRNQVRVSVIPFGLGVYPENGFNLTTYQTKAQVKQAIGNIKHKVGLYTSTGMGIDYMHNVQMAEARDYAERIAVVLTDGNSQLWNETKYAAKFAREDGIEIFAVGVGSKHTVRDSELMNIAGNASRIIRVERYNKLKDIVKQLANETCIRKFKPTTTPPPPTECGEEFPADINFLFSPADLGIDGTSWATNFISVFVNHEDMNVGFRFGAVTGSCPEDEGFDLAEYDAREISERLSLYSRDRMTELVDRAIGHAYSEDAGGRADAPDVAVLIATYENEATLQEDVQRMLDAGITVFVADPYGIGLDVSGAYTLEGNTPREAALDLVSSLCA